ncbi:DUF881 domain-containing protein [Embleya sp. NPDC056575]|uniref:DUF881 domain-containing protein n=1 Tax=unclassified Embleya TaxID=2699296 RepID=UPI00368F62B5
MPAPGIEPEPEAPSARKPTIETRRPVDLYHEGRHIRERIREQAAEVTSEIAPITAPVRESAHEIRNRLPAREPRETPEPGDPSELPHAGARAEARDTPGPESDSLGAAPPEEAELADPHPVASHAAEPVDDQPGRRRLIEAFWPPRVSRAQLVGAVLLFALGAGLAIQVRSNNESDPLRGARQEDLVRVLDELNARTRRLEDEKHRLENSRTQLQSSNDRVQEARQQNAAKADALGVLAGTVKASGPGITLTITDPQRQVTGDVLLDTLQELRAAGAEVIQINDVRVVAGTWFNGTPPGDIVIDDVKVLPPYVFKVIGNPQDLQPALNIPGGVVKTLEKKQAGAIVTPSQDVQIDALRPANKPGYARSAPGAGNG